MRGGGGRDILSGGTGDDIICGGKGLDTMSGGSDADIFKFNKISHSPNSTNRDTIQDFNAAEDVIDLNKIIPWSLSFIGANAFKITGAGEVNYTVEGNNGIIQVDSDGNGVVDMQIKVKNVTFFTEFDFLL
ncbi:MAG: serralysin [Paracoccaceae bacterium]